MARTNEPVFQVLVLGDVAPLVTAGRNVTQLLPGQFGIFNYDTGLSIDTTDATTMRRIFLAVGYDRDGDGVTDDVTKSTGEYMETKRIHWLSVQCPEACQGQIIQITPQNIKGEKEYILKVELHNEFIAMTYGKNLLTKSFTVKTPCCESQSFCECTDSTVCSYLAKELVKAINNDVDNILVATLFDTTANAVVDIDDYEDWIEDSDNEGSCLALRITSNCETVKQFCQINYNYKKLRAFRMTIAFKQADTLTSAGTITEIQELQYPEGQGYDVQQLESEAGGWNGKPGLYRQYDLIGGSNGNFELNAVKNETYVFCVVGHDAMSISGWGEYINDMETIICVPCSAVETIFSGQNTGLGWLFETVLEANNVNIPVVGLTLPADCCGEDSSSE